MIYSQSQVIIWNFVLFFELILKYRNYFEFGKSLNYPTVADLKKL